MNPQQVDQARDSLSRCVKQTGFLDRFYELLMASSDEIKAKFETTDFDRQMKVLQDSLFVMMVAAGTTSGMAHKELAKLAERHNRNSLAIKPEWYKNWLDCLMKTVAEVDPEYTPELDAAWRESLRGGIELLSSKY
jgi:hemoglobin-like flavoprotein